MFPDEHPQREAFGNIGESLLNSLLEGGEEPFDEGRIVKEAINQGISSFVPDMILRNLVQNYRMAKNLYGETLLTLLTGCSPEYLERNIRLPEFQREVEKKIAENISKLKEDSLVDKDGMINDKGVEMAALILYVEELDKLVQKGAFGEHVNKKDYLYGLRSDTRAFRKQDRYRDLAIKRTIKTAIRRGHGRIDQSDLMSFEREAKSRLSVVYALDASGSMRGEKINAAKKAGIALSFRAIENSDNVGLVVFGKSVKAKVEPTKDFGSLAKEIARVRASDETNFVETIKTAAGLYRHDASKHLMILTDALPTSGEKPEEETMEAVSAAACQGITISVIGISLDKEGERIARRIAEIGEGRLYTIRNLDELDRIVLEDYEEVRGA